MSGTNSKLCYQIKTEFWLCQKCKNHGHSYGNTQYIKIHPRSSIASDVIRASLWSNNPICPTSICLSCGRSFAKYFKGLKVSLVGSVQQTQWTPFLLVSLYYLWGEHLGARDFSSMWHATGSVTLYRQPYYLSAWVIFQPFFIFFFFSLSLLQYGSNMLVYIDMSYIDSRWQEIPKKLSWQWYEKLENENFS